MEIEMILDSYRAGVNKFRSEDIRDIMLGIPAQKSGTVKSWFSNKMGKQILAVSFDIDENGEVVSGWSPGIREVDSVRSTFVTLEGSRMDYNGTVLASHENYIVFSHPWGDRTKVWGYRVF